MSMETVGTMRIGVTRVRVNLDGQELIVKQVRISITAGCAYKCKSL